MSNNGIIGNKERAANVRTKKSFGELYSKYGTFAILAILVILSALLSDRFLTPANLINILRQNAVIAIMGFGTTFIMCVGGINIAYDKILGLTGCIGCTAFVMSGGNIFVGIAAALLCGVLVGAFYGNMVTKFNLPPFIVGLAISSIAEGIVMIYTNAAPIQGIKNTWFSWLGQGYIFSIPTPIVICLIMMVVTWFILRKTTFGRHCVATGGNRAAAEACGIRTKRVINTVYILDGLLCALAACVFMGRLGVGQPSPGQGYGFDAITGVVIGGASLDGGSGGAIGTLVGILVVGVLNNIMNLKGISSYYQLLVKGGMILIAVIIDMKTKESIAKSGMKK